MTLHSENSNNGNAARTGAPGGAEETLRLIAALPAPKGLEERVHHSLEAARAMRSVSREKGVLAWPVPLSAGSEWMRAAAAAAIAFVIAGGGWGVYRQVQPQLTVNGVTLAPHGAMNGGLAGASAMRTPQTLHGPVLSHPATQAAVQSDAQSDAQPVVANPTQAPSPTNTAKKNGTAASRVKRPATHKAKSQSQP